MGQQMGHKFAIDFGTTNTVVAHWNEASKTAEIINFPAISTGVVEDRPILVPSLLYVNDGKSARVTIGQAVQDQGFDQQKDNRLFRNFKRGIVASPSPEPRTIDEQLWGDREAGRNFIRKVIDAFPYPKSDIEQLVLTAPVASFEGYITWLNGVTDEIAPDKIRVVDESTAAALGYTVNKPGAVILVFDFGGGTLDLSLVQLPESREKTGGILQRLLKGNTSQHSAKVIAKAGRVIGGSDIDQWVLAEVLKRTGVSAKELGHEYATLLTRSEQAKIALSTTETADIAFEAGGKTHQTTFTRSELETLLEANGFYTALRRVVDKVMHVAHQRGIFKEDIHYVLTVGGISLMPSVQRTLGQYFSNMAVQAHKPFTAVAEGALQVAAGFGLEDYLIHSYGLRYLDLATGEHQFDEIVPMGSQYPSEQPIEVILGPAHADQEAIEFVIGEIDTDAISMIEVQYENGQAVFVAQADSSGQQIVSLNEGKAVEMLAKLMPPGKLGEDRLKAAFTIDNRRQLRMTVTDILSNKVLLDNVAVVSLR
jgi:molecular chaperone DnaK (HSP70)